MRPLRLAVRAQLAFVLFFGLSVGLMIVPAVVAQVAQQHCCTAQASGPVVTSLNTETGDVTLDSPNGSITFSIAGQIIHASGVPCPTAGANVTITGCPSAGWTIAATGGGGGGGVTLLSSPNPISSPNYTQLGYTAYQGMMLDCNGPIQASPSPGWNPSSCPDLITVQSGNGQCEGGDYSWWGTTPIAVSGVVGQNFAVSCGGDPIFTVGGHGDVGIGSGLYGTLAYMRSYIFYDASTTTDQCWFHDVQNTGVVFAHVNTGVCNFYLQDIPGSSALATDSNGEVVPASTLATQNGEATCTVTGATLCLATVPARSGSKCTGAYNTDDTTVPLSGLKPAAYSVSNKWFTLQTASATGTIALDYWCP